MPSGEFCPKQAQDPENTTFCTFSWGHIEKKKKMSFGVCSGPRNVIY